MDLQALVQLRDASDAPLARDFRVPKSHATPTGGLREEFGFWWGRYDQNPATPAKLVVAVPLELKEAALLFEFKDVKLP